MPQSEGIESAWVVSSESSNLSEREEGFPVYPLRSSAVRLSLDPLRWAAKTEARGAGVVSEVASFALERFNVGDKVLYADAAQVLIGLNLMKDWAPDRHLVRAVRGWSLRTFEHVADAVAGKLPSGVLGDQGKVGHFGVESGGRRTVSLPVESVAGGAVGAENGMGIQAFDGGYFFSWAGQLGARKEIVANWAATQNAT